MSLLGAIVELYKSSQDPPMVALRAALGVGKMYADLVPDNIRHPIVVLGENSTSVLNASKTGPERPTHRSVVVGFNLYARTRAEAEDLLDKMEAAFCESEQSQLSISATIVHNATYFNNRTMVFDGEAWRAMLELDYRITKTPA